MKPLLLFQGGVDVTSRQYLLRVRPDGDVLDSIRNVAESMVDAWRNHHHISGLEYLGLRTLPEYAVLTRTDNLPDELVVGGKRPDVGHVRARDERAGS